MPHPGHCLTRSIKDVFPRYKTMRGYRCERKAGWDTHGLPVEVEVGKELGIHSKEEIEAYGEEPFIQKCQQSVWRYMQEWQQLTRTTRFLGRSGRSLCDLSPELRGKRLVEPEKSVRSRTVVPRSQDRLVVGARWHGTCRRAKSARATAKSPTRASMSCFRWSIIPSTLAGGLDDDALDAAEQHVRSRPSVGDRVLRW